MKLAGRYVQLRSGGPLLQIHVVCTVRGLTHALCRWRHDDARMRCRVFPVHVLTTENTQ